MLLSKPSNEHVLLQRIAINDEQAFRELFMSYHHEIGSFVNSLLNDREATLEIVQDIFLKIWMNRTNLTEINNFTSYLFIITRNYVLNRIRQLVKEKEKHNAYLQTAAGAISSSIDEHQVDMEERYQLLEKAVNNLPPQQQKVFTLRQQGLKNPEIAKALNISTVSVVKYQQLALRFINEYVKAYGVILPLLYIYLL